jgi:hypothetical protein
VQVNGDVILAAAVLLLINNRRECAIFGFVLVCVGVR